MANDREKAIVAEAVAKKVSYSHNVDSGVTTLVRRFPNVSDGDISLVLTYLNTISTVTDPVVDGLTYSGTWNVVTNSDGELLQPERTQGIVQVLTLGSHSVASSLQSADCRYKTYRTFYFAVASIPTTPGPAGTTTYSRGPVSFDDRTGLFSTHIDARVPQSRTRSDSELTETPMESVVETEILGGAAANIANLVSADGYIYNQEVRVRDDCSMDITNRIRTAKSRDAYWHSGGSLQKQYEHLYQNTSTLPDFLTATKGVVYDTRASVNEFGIYNVGVVARQGVYGIYEFDSRMSPFVNERTVQYNNTQFPISVPAPGGPGMYRGKFQPQNDGLYTGEVTYQYGNNTGFYEFRSGNTHLGYSDTKLYKSYNHGMAAPATSQGITYNATNALGEDGLYDSQVRAQVSYARNTVFVADVTPFSSSSTTVYRNAASVATPSAPNSGRIRTTARLNDDQTFDQDVRIDSPTGGDATFRSSGGLLRTSTETTHVGKSTYQNAPVTPVRGEVYAVRNALLDDGTYNSSVQKSVAVEDEASWISKVGLNAKQNSATHLYKNTLALYDLDQISGEGLYTQNLSINSDGTYDVVTTYTPPLSSGGAMDMAWLSQYQYNAQATTDVLLGLTSEAAAPTNVMYGMYNVTNRRAPDGTIEATRVYTTPKATELYQAWFVKGNPAFMYVYRNQPLNTINIQTGCLNGRDDAVNDVSRTFNPDGTEDIIVTSRPNVETSGGGSYWLDYDDAFTFYDHNFRNNAGVDQTRSFFMGVYTKQVGTKGAAHDWIPVGNSRVYSARVTAHGGGENFESVYNYCLGDTGWV